MTKRERHRRSSERSLRLHFMGATRCVTGSLHFFEYNDGQKTIRFFIDAGLNQETPSANRNNRLPRGIKPSDVDFGIFSHGHVDHIGFLPKLAKDGFTGKVYATAATRDIASLLLPDCGFLQEEEAKRLTRQRIRHAQNNPSPRDRQQSKRSSGKAGSTSVVASTQHDAEGIEPLYTQDDAKACLHQIEVVEFDSAVKVADGITIRFVQASHILGAAIVCLEIGTGSTKRRIVFSGDLGRPNMPILQNVAAVKKADYVICEGTYGDRLHQKRDRLKVLEEIIKRAYERAKVPDKKFGHGVIVIPAFAVGRVQAVLSDLRELMEAGRIPNIQVFLDSPLAIKSTEVHRQYRDLYNKKHCAIADSGSDPFRTPRYAELLDYTQSMQLDRPQSEPIIVVGSSGMAVGGRIMRHLENRLPGAQNTVVFIGYQGNGTTGRALTTPGVESVKINGKPVSVRATIEQISDYSGHADYEDIIRWLSAIQPRPKRLFLVHGDEESLGALKVRIEDRLNWEVTVPALREYVDLD